MLASGEFLCTLNSDTEVRAGALDRLVDFLRENPAYGACAPKLVDPDGSVQHACQRFAPTLLTALCFDTWWGTWWPGGRAVPRRGPSSAGLRPPHVVRRRPAPGGGVLDAHGGMAAVWWAR